MTQQCRHCDSAFRALASHGVPQGRARTVRNGIQVLVTRMHRESVAQSVEIQRLHAMADELVSQCESYHLAVDMLFALLIEKTQNESPMFYPSKSGHPWAACTTGHALIQRVRASATPTTK